MKKGLARQTADFDKLQRPGLFAKCVSRKLKNADRTSAQRTIYLFPHCYSRARPELRALTSHCVRVFSTLRIIEWIEGNITMIKIVNEGFDCVFTLGTYFT